MEAFLPSQLHWVPRLATTSNPLRLFEASSSGGLDLVKYERDILAQVAHHIQHQPSTEKPSVKTCYAYPRPSAPRANLPFPVLNHLSASSFRLEVLSVAFHMVTFPAHHRIEGIGGGPYADRATLDAAVNDVDVVVVAAAAVGDGEVAVGARRAREAD